MIWLEEKIKYSENIIDVVFYDNCEILARSLVVVVISPSYSSNNQIKAFIVVQYIQFICLFGYSVTEQCAFSFISRLHP